MRRKKGTQDAATTGDARITPEEVQQVEFRLAFRGYNERDVDAFLDRVTEGLSAYLEELERLRLAPPHAVPGGSGDAEAVLARARAEADEIVRRAHEQAAGTGAAAGAGSGDARSAVAPFLNTEREFLQSLGSLVQEHAEEIKQMVLALRERADAAAAAEAPAATPSPAPSNAAAESFEPASAAEIRERLRGDEPAGSVAPPDPADARPAEAPPVVVESSTEPVFTTEGAPVSERRERSLRELFWGED